MTASRAIAEELGRRWDEQLYPALAGYLAWSEGGPPAAEPAFRNAYQVQAEIGDRANAWFIAPPLARVLLALGRDSAAEEILQYLRGTAGASAPIQGRSIAAVIAARRGDLADALGLSTEAENLAATTDLLWDQADVALDRAEVLLLAGRPVEAHAAAEVALERFERKEYAIGIRRAREFLAALPG